MEEPEVPLEHLHEHVHESAEHSGETWIGWVALSTAILAVLAAIAGLLSGKHANEAMMSQIQASDQWSYYQAKSIKAAVLDAKLSLGGNTGAATPVASSAAPTTLSPTAMGKKTVAILPFEVSGEDPEKATLASQIEAQILGNLAMATDVKVPSPEMAKSPRNLRAIGEKLGAEFIVEGTVRAADGRLRVNVQLVNAQTDQHVWANAYDQPVAELIPMANDLSKTLLSQLERTVSGGEKTAAADKPSAGTANQEDREKFSRYEKEQAEIKKEAEHKEAEAKANFHKHEVFARGVTMFQIAIAVAAISALTRRRRFWLVSLVFGAVGCVFLVLGFIAH